MSREERITCDQCGAVKKETNNWYRAWIYGDQFRLSHASIESEGVEQDICGHQCAIAALNQFLQTGKLNTGKIEEKA